MTIALLKFPTAIIPPSEVSDTEFIHSVPSPVILVAHNTSPFSPYLITIPSEPPAFVRVFSVSNTISSLEKYPPTRNSLSLVSVTDSI